MEFLCLFFLFPSFAVCFFHWGNLHTQLCRAPLSADQHIHSVLKSFNRIKACDFPPKLLKPPHSRLPSFTLQCVNIARVYVNFVSSRFTLKDNFFWEEVF